MRYVLVDLSPVDAVEVIVFPTGENIISQIRQQHPDLSPENMKAYVLAAVRASRDVLHEPDELSGVPVEGELAQEVASLWRQLPYAEQMRCHLPPYALRFWRGADVVLTASICWRCNNIWITEGAERKYAHFDGEADISQHLFHRLEEVVASQTP